MKKINYKKILKKKNGVFIFLILVLPVVSFNYLKDKMPLEKSEGVSLVRCVDGDTARMNIDGEEKVVRFLAIDTPETVKPNTPIQPYGKEASNYTCNALTNASEINLEYESDKTDKYDRLLAWVWVDGIMLQQSLIEQGLAEVKYIYGNYKYTDQLKALQEKAKEQSIGIWN